MTCVLHPYTLAHLVTRLRNHLCETTYDNPHHTTQKGHHGRASRERTDGLARHGHALRHARPSPAQATPPPGSVTRICRRGTRVTRENARCGRAWRRRQAPARRAMPKRRVCPPSQRAATRFHKSWMTPVPRARDRLRLRGGWVGGWSFRQFHYFWAVPRKGCHAITRPRLGGGAAHNLECGCKGRWPQSPLLALVRPAVRACCVASALQPGLPACPRACPTAGLPTLASATLVLA